MESITKEKVLWLRSLSIVYHDRNDGNCAKEFFYVHLNHLSVDKQHEKIREWIHTGSYQEIIYPDDPRLCNNPMYVFKILSFVQNGQVIPVYLKVQEESGKALVISLHKYMCNR